VGAIRRTVELQAGQENLLLPQGLFMIDRRERPRQDGWYNIEYDPFDQFIAIVGLAVEDAGCPGMFAQNVEGHAHGN
jgi:hypothetical protein